MNFQYQKGISLYLSIVVMAILLTIVLGLTLILSNQLKMIQDTEKSVVALYAADAGIERVLVDIIHNNSTPETTYVNTLDNGATYTVSVVCCNSVPPCIWNAGNPCPASLSPSPDCNSYTYCAKSLGKYKGTTRGLWVDI